IEGIGLLATASDWTDLGQGINPDKARRFGRLAPCLDILEAALVGALPFGVNLKAFWCFPALHDLVDSLFQPPLVVLQREIECIALYWLYFSKHKAITSDSYADVESEKAFADFRLACDNCYTLWDKSRHDNPHGRELFCLKFGGGNQPITPG